MSKPGGKAIVRKRPFYEDQNIAILSDRDDRNRIVSFEFIDKLNDRNNKIFIVENYKILKAWERLQEHCDPIVAKLLKQPRAKR